jgi:hypothetical protein
MFVCVCVFVCGCSDTQSKQSRCHFLAWYCDGIVKGVDLRAVCTQEQIHVCWERVPAMPSRLLAHLTRFERSASKQMIFTCLYSFANRIQERTYWKGTFLAVD